MAVVSDHAHLLEGHDLRPLGPAVVVAEKLVGVGQAHVGRSEHGLEQHGDERLATAGGALEQRGPPDFAPRILHDEAEVAQEHLGVLVEEVVDVGLNQSAEFSRPLLIGLGVGRAIGVHEPGLRHRVCDEGEARVRRIVGELIDAGDADDVQEVVLGEDRGLAGVVAALGHEVDVEHVVEHVGGVAAVPLTEEEHVLTGDVAAPLRPAGQLALGCGLDRLGRREGQLGDAVHLLAQVVGGNLESRVLELPVEDGKQIGAFELGEHRRGGDAAGGLDHELLGGEPRGVQPCREGLVHLHRNLPRSDPASSGGAEEKSAGGDRLAAPGGLT